MPYFKYKELVMTGFRSFKNKTVFKLDREPGLYFIHGKNLLEPKISPNGSGKSSILDAFIYAHTGKSVSGLRGPLVKNWQSKSGDLTLTLDRDDVPFQIDRKIGTTNVVRTEGHNNSETISQDTMDNFILDWDKILFTNLIGQKSSTFLDLEPTKKLNTVSDVIGLSLWERCSDAAKAASTKSESRLTSLNSDLVGARSKLESLAGQRVTLQAKEKEFEEERVHNVSKLQNEMEGLGVAVADLQKFEDDAKFQLELRQEELHPLNTKLEKLDASKDEVNIKLASVGKDIAVLNSQKESSTKVLQKWMKLTDKCPYCEQDVAKDFVTFQKSILTKEIVQIGTKIKELTESKAALTDELGKIILDLNAVKLENTSVVSKVRSQETVWNQIKTDKIRKVQDHDILDRRIKDLNTQENPYTALITANDSNVDKEATIVVQTEKYITDVTKELTGYQFWIKGFKELRLWIVNDALSTLEVETNNELSDLGLTNWALKFRMERETKAGDISKGFNVLVNSPHYKDSKDIPFEVWSGGEGQRLKLATIRGFSNLISNYKGIDFNVEFYDEPSTFLSEQGIEMLIATLEERARTHNKTIYFIDQRQLTSPLFKQIITVVKDENGISHIEE